MKGRMLVFVALFVAVAALKAPIPGETLLQLEEERADYPPEMEGGEAPAPAPTSIDMNATPKHDAAIVVDSSNLALLEVEPCVGSECEAALKPSCVGDECKNLLSKASGCIGDECNGVVKPSCVGDECNGLKVAPSCLGGDCKHEVALPQTSSCVGDDCKQAVKPACSGDECNGVKDEAKPAVKELMGLLEEATKPLSDTEMNLIQDAVKAGADLLFKTTSKHSENEQILLQTDTPTKDTKFDWIGTFAKLIDYPITDSEKTQLNQIVSTFSALLTSEEPNKNLEKMFGLTSLIALPDDEHPVKLIDEFADAFSSAMDSHFPSHDMEEATVRGGATMPESGPDSGEDFDMDAMSTQKPTETDANSFESKFNMNVNVNKMMDENRIHADVTLMNGPPKPAKMIRSALIPEDIDVPKGPDAMQRLSSMSSDTLDLMDEQQVFDEKDENGITMPQGATQTKSIDMPEATHDFDLVNEMEKNVKVTQIPDHTV